MIFSKRIVHKPFIITIIVTLLLSFVLPSSLQKVNAGSNNNLGDTNDNTEFPANWSTATSTLQLHAFKQSELKQSDVSANGAIGTGIKGLKALGKIVKHGGTTLSWLLKPFSKKVAKAVKKNSKKIADALEKPEKATKSYIKKELTKRGVSEEDADTIVFWIFLII